jgi:5-methylcytosine-specific restriction endonuclease McrA
VELSRLSDEALFGRIESLVRTERFSMVDLLVHLGELDSRPACQNKGYPTVFAYLTRHLGFAESDAIRRVRVARAAKKYPSILRMLANGELNLVGVALIQTLLNSENYETLILKAARRTTREIERMVADMSPAKAPPRDSIRALPPPPPESPTSAEPPSTTVATVPSDLLELVVASSPATPPPYERKVVFNFAASEEVRAWFDAARDLLRHRFPSGAMEEVIGEALRRLVEQEMPRSTRRRKTPIRAVRRIPKSVEADVWRRDGGRCAFMGPEGVRCGETAWLELDHVVPWAKGGRSDDSGNVRLLCRAHNQAEARRIFGDGRRGGRTAVLNKLNK